MKRFLLFIAVAVCFLLFFSSCSKDGMILTSKSGNTTVKCSINSQSLRVGQDLVVNLTSDGEAEYIITFDDIVEAYVTTFPYKFKKEMTEKGKHELKIGPAPIDVNMSSIGKKMSMSSSTSFGITVR